MKTAMYRQGDVLLERIDEAIASDAKLVPREGGATVLAYGESSGHRHQIARGAKLFERTGGRFLHVSAKGGATLEVTTDRGERLSPQRHEPVRLPPGIYRVTTQREWTASDEVRQVQD
jgi:hypothetical protein